MRSEESIQEQMNDVEDYARTCEYVATFNEEAANYLKYDAPKLLSFMSDKKVCRAFIWDETPQGSDYWYAIDTRLDENYY